MNDNQLKCLRVKELEKGLTLCPCLVIGFSVRPDREQSELELTWKEYRELTSFACI